MTASIVVRHNFETAHRLPFLPGKCQSLHGHSWWAEVSIFGEPDEHGVLLDFGTVKADLRAWIDRELDHGCMLGRADRLAGWLMASGCKVFVFDPDDAGSLCAEGTWIDPSGDAWKRRPLPWPTVENVAELIRRHVQEYLARTADWPLSVHVRVQETHVNEATAR